MIDNVDAMICDFLPDFSNYGAVLGGHKPFLLSCFPKARLYMSVEMQYVYSIYFLLLLLWILFLQIY